MYIESNDDKIVLSQEIIGEPSTRNVLENLPVVDYRIYRSKNKHRKKDNAMKFNEDYSTYHSENNCRDWIVTD